ncbi:MAG TPA: PadR family transcriptional regulator [Anaerolineae bacterium]|nr:PadR family transcriptional regulator [Anaerolineae bacterium]
MPRGPRWRGGRGAGPCPRRIHRFVEPCLLLLLHRDRTHGYDLLEGLKEFGFEEAPVDSSVVYRALREMEAQGLVTSTWDTTGRGPPRRVYRITAEGDRYLASWVRDLRETDRVLHHFLAAYDEHMRRGKGEHH